MGFLKVWFILSVKKYISLFFFSIFKFVFTVELHLSLKPFFFSLQIKNMKFYKRIKQFIMKINLGMKKNLYLSFPVLIRGRPKVGLLKLN